MSTLTAVSKICPKCRNNKPIEDFSTANDKRDGRASWCRKCVSERYHKVLQCDPKYKARERERSKLRLKDPEYSERHNAYNREWRKRPEVAARRKAGHIRRCYGIHPEVYHEMVARQMGLCAICGEVPKTKQGLCVDHDHSTGHVRGLLCNNCNAGMGYLKDNEKVLESALSYLKKAKEELT